MNNNNLNFNTNSPSKRRRRRRKSYGMNYNVTNVEIVDDKYETLEDGTPVNYELNFLGPRLSRRRKQRNICHC